MRFPHLSAPVRPGRRASGATLFGLVLSLLLLLGVAPAIAQPSIQDDDASASQDDEKDDASKSDDDKAKKKDDDDKDKKDDEDADEEEPLEPLPPGLVLRAKRVIVRPGKEIENGLVHVRGGRIVAVGTDIAIPEGAEVIEGEVVCAGFLDAWSTFGLTPTSAGRPDTKVVTRAVDGVDLYHSDHERRRTLRAGVTSVGVHAGRTASVSGVGAVTRVAPGMAMGDAVLLNDACVTVSVGLNGDAFDRIGHVDRLVKQLRTGADYRVAHTEFAYDLAEWEAEIAKAQAKLEKDEKKAKKDREKAKAKAEKDGKEFKEKRYKEDKRPKEPKFDAEKAVWARVAEGELPLFVQAHRVSELRALLAGTKDFGRLRMVVLGGTHALPFAEQLAARRIPVVVWPAPNGTPAANQVDKRDLSLAARLDAAGVEVLLASGGTSNARDLPLLAATAVGHGLDRDAALRALTSGAARLLDVGDRLGRVHRGLEADLLVLNGDPLAASTRVQYVLTAGQVVLTPEEN